MTAFERLDPLVQHHIVNSLGWRELRLLQEASIEPVLRGDDCLLLAPTAGGKTEAAMFPLLSRMCSERWAAPSIIYVCPLKALLNNLGERLDRYTQMLGRRSAVWHGDIGQSERRQVRADAPDVLLTTPESLEAMLISTNASMRSQLRSLRAVVVDEIHAFAGDDRGWHLLCVLQRLVASAGHDLQRIGLSATVGNPEALLDWFSSSTGRRTVVQPPVESPRSAEVVLDYVGSLENAAVVISRLHRGEKRLVFCDSRSRVEALGGMLRGHGVDVFVSHSSLSAAERKRSEEAFARGGDCVIVSTSTLELGIDVGDLDRVIQIDAPMRVASFLQRLGRTGRRAGKSKNCLFLCTSEDALLQAAALLSLWQQGFVEPISAPPLPYHIVAQQALALCLQHGGIGKRDLLAALSALPISNDLSPETIAELLNHLQEGRLLESDGARYFVGDKGEESYGRRYFSEIVSVFTSAPVLTVTDGLVELGVLDVGMFMSGAEQNDKVLSLGGRGWRVQRVDWKERRVYVLPAEGVGKSVWLGSSRGLSFVLCRAIRTLLTNQSSSELWSSRAMSGIEEARRDYTFLRGDSTTLLLRDRKPTWFSFAGEAINSAIADGLAKLGHGSERVSDYAVSFPEGTSLEAVDDALKVLSPIEVLANLPVAKAAEEALKFSECVPPSLLKVELAVRRCSAAELQTVLNEQRHRCVTTTEDFE